MSPRRPAVKRPASSASRRPGRPRDPAVRAAILEAARALLEEVGVSGLTVEGIAARAGVGKPTVYRAWPNAQAVAMAALMEEPAPEARGGRRAAGPLASLRRQLRAIARVFATRTGRHVTIMLASADGDSELARVFRNHFILARREEGRALLAAAAEAGEVRADLDVDVALDLIYAPIFYRLLVGHAPLDDAFTEAVLTHALAGLAPPRRRAAARRPARPRGS